MIGVSAVAVRLHSHNMVSHVHHLLNGVVYLVADDGSPPRCHGVSPPGPHTHSGCGPERDDSSRRGSAQRSRGGQEHPRAHVGTPGVVGPWSEAGHPRRVYNEGSHPISSEK
jgi:hypothetical protein